MSDVQTENVVATISSEKVEEKAIQQKVEEEAEVTADSRSDGEEEIEITNWEAEDNSEDYVPKQEVDEEEEDDSCSSGEEEVGVDVKLIEHGGQKFFKLKYEEVEQRRKAIEEQMKEEEKEDASEEEDEAIDDNNGEAKESTKTEMKESFKEYRTATILDEEMDKEYKSDEDEYFDPMNCEGTLTDIEYSSGDERDTESEPEVEPLEGTHKKTGETLMCIKMIEQLQIPPRDQPCSTAEFSGPKVTDQPMECS